MKARGTGKTRLRVRPINLSAILLCLLAGCSVYMEATRPAPVDLSKFQPGQDRDSVVQQLGVPVTTEAQPGGESCDLYELFVTGHGTFRKAATMFVEGASDVVMPVAELLWTPAQAVTRDQKHPEWFCYETQKLVSVGAKPSPSAIPTPSPMGGTTPVASPVPATLVTKTAPAATPTPSQSR
jgi:hypothetical protein